MIVSASYALGHQTLWLGSVLSNETDPTFAHQFNETAPCPADCQRVTLPGKRVSQCTANPGWRESWEKRRGEWEADLIAEHGAHSHAHDEL
jgi:hypothetical protein